MVRALSSDDKPARVKRRQGSQKACGGENGPIPDVSIRSRDKLTAGKP